MKTRLAVEQIPAGLRCSVCKGYGDIWVNWHPTPVKCGHCEGSGLRPLDSSLGTSDPRPDPKTHPEYWTE